MLLHGEALQELRALPDCSIDSVVTDPPYGLTQARPGGRSDATRGAVMGGFMGMKWDSDVPSVEVWAECLRVLKPGGHLLAFAGTRTQHRMAVRIEDAGFEIRDMIAWVYGSGFPKSLDVSKAIDKAAGAEREVIGDNPNGRTTARTSEAWARPWNGDDDAGAMKLTAPATDAARQWQGWGTALKPALEPITVARKPLIGTVAANVLTHCTGALNIDGCRVGTDTVTTHSRGAATSFAKRPGEKTVEESGRVAPQNRAEFVGNARAGRWPANLIHDGSEDVMELFPVTKSGGAPLRRQGMGYNGGAQAARFFYCAKASKSERGPGNTHPTVKPLALMRYLVRLVTPPGGTVLDPFMGSGTTGLAAAAEGFRFVGIERDEAYFEIARRRLTRENARG